MSYKALVVGIFILCFSLTGWAWIPSSTHHYHTSSSNKYTPIPPKPIYVYNGFIYHSGTHQEIGQIPAGITNTCASSIISAYPHPVICKTDLPEREWWDYTLVGYTEYNWNETTVAFTKAYTWDMHTIPKSRVEKSVFIRNLIIFFVFVCVFGFWEERRTKRASEERRKKRLIAWSPNRVKQRIHARFGSDK